MELNSKTQTPLIAGLVGGAVALIGALSMPYGFYSVMKFVVAVSCAVIAGSAICRDKQLIVAPLAIVGLFMFLVKGLPKEMWSCIDLVVAVFLVSIGGWLSTQPVKR